MKKIIVFISLFFTSILITNATPCKVISGDGSNIGDEIKCGTEHFYVLSNDGENIEMLAKYNLYVGSDYYKIVFDETFSSIDQAHNYWNENYEDDYDILFRWLYNSDYEYYGVLAQKYIEIEEVKQDEKAIGAHGNLKVEPLFPEMGVYNFFSTYNPDEGFRYNYMNPAYRENLEIGKAYIDVDIDLHSTAPATLLDWFVKYKETLNKYDIEVKNITILSVADISNLVKEVTGKELPLEDWWNNKDEWGVIYNGAYEYAIVGSVKDQMPEGYEWLWSTTYWTRTISSSDDENMYFIDVMGDLCNADYCTGSIGAGIRPVVTIPAYLIYQIETKTDGNGTVEADHIEAEGGTEVKFTVTPNEGYVLNEVKVTDSKGNVIIFKDYTFTMPNANVLIEATFVPIPKKENPDTSDIIAIACTLLVISGILLTFTNNKKKSLR